VDVYAAKFIRAWVIQWLIILAHELHKLLIAAGTTRFFASLLGFVLFLNGSVVYLVKRYVHTVVSKIKVRIVCGWKRRECGSLSSLVVTIIAMASEFCLSHIDAFFRRSGLNAERRALPRVRPWGSFRPQLVTVVYPVLVVAFPNLVAFFVSNAT
jgi:hypothetical protein